jgi:hypothetical protein
LIVPGGIGSMTVGRAIVGSSTSNPTVIAAGNPVDSTKGKIGSLTAKLIFATDIVANNLGSLSTTKGSVFDQNLGFSLNGDVSQSNLVVTGSGPFVLGTTTIQAAIGSLSLAGNLRGTGGLGGGEIDAPNSIGSFRVAGLIFDVPIAAGYNIVTSASGTVTSGINSFSAGSISGSSELPTESITTNAIGTFSVPGNANTGLVGNVSNTLVTFVSKVNGSALGTALIAGTARQSTFNAEAGNVGSFTTGRFIDCVVATLSESSDLSADHTAGPNFTGSFSIGSFKTTAVLNATGTPTDLANTVSFSGSIIVAAKLRTINLTSVDPSGQTTDAIQTGAPQGDPVIGVFDVFTTTYGIGFESGANGSKGTVIIGNISSTPLAPSINPLKVGTKTTNAFYDNLA